MIIRDPVISAVEVYAVVKDMLVMDALDSLETDFVILVFYPVIIKLLLKRLKKIPQKPFCH